MLSLFRSVSSATTLCRLAPALTASVHSSAPGKTPASALASSAPPAADPSQIESALAGMLGVSLDQAHSILVSHPAIAAQCVKPSILFERLELLAVGLGLSPSRLRALVLQKPDLLSDLSVDELHSMAGFNK
ncbi:hypothetical protein ACK3TF_005509 [Chlorella vulgaris]